MGFELSGRIDPAAVEVTRTAQFVMQTLLALRQSCEEKRQELSQLRDTLRRDEAFRQKYLREDLEPIDPEHVGYGELYLAGYRHAEQVLSGWFHGMPPYADRLASLRESIDAGLAAIGDTRYRKVGEFLIHVDRQQPLRWGGYLPRVWEVLTVADLAERVVETLTKSFAHKPYDGSAERWRQTVRSAVSNVIDSAERIGRILQSDEELRNLEGELARDLNALELAAVPDVQTVAHRENGGNFQPAEETLPSSTRQRKARKPSRHHAEAKYPKPPGVSANTWMQEMLSKHPEVAGWSIGQWEQGIGVARSTISETDSWKASRMVRAGIVIGDSKRSRRPN